MATTALTLAGLFLSMLVVCEDVCCMYGYHRGLGYPWAWLDSYTTTDNVAAIDAIRSDPAALEKSVDWSKVVLDGLFWWHVALLVVVPAMQARRRSHLSARDRSARSRAARAFTAPSSVST
ncbi:hypothetical protein OIE67_52975 [Nonomuraea fuscirosea]|uniref:hypothetical protein n=2 Tax=Nonomuraea fuscirosea TaxID=1291556 RepID=UPI002DD80D62|nr:hypothetical protein [Nonomuraea fuscirosea]WSA52638.1 hypothetical protein OIE67_52975 [Nonomuraea fuscirosea]